MSDPAAQPETTEATNEDLEVQVTPEMIAAGITCLIEELDDLITYYWPQVEIIARRVFLAMESTRGKALKSKHPGARVGDTFAQSEMAEPSASRRPVAPGAEA